MMQVVVEVVEDDIDVLGANVNDGAGGERAGVLEGDVSRDVFSGSSHGGGVDAEKGSEDVGRAGSMLGNVLSGQCSFGSVVFIVEGEDEDELGFFVHANPLIVFNINVEFSGSIGRSVDRSKGNGAVEGKVVEPERAERVVVDHSNGARGVHGHRSSKIPTSSGISIRVCNEVNGRRGHVFGLEHISEVDFVNIRSVIILPKSPLGSTRGSRPDSNSEFGGRNDLVLSEDERGEQTNRQKRKHET